VTVYNDRFVSHWFNDKTMLPMLN